MPRRRGGALMNILAIVAVIGIAIAFILPSTCASRETANRVKCQSNLAQIGKALLLYSNENNGSFPQTHYVPGAPISLTNDGVANANPFAVAPTPGTTNNIPAAMFLLIRTEDLTTEVFTCPSGTAEKDQMANLAATSRGNFTGDGKPGGSVINNVSYSFVNVYPSQHAVEKLGYKTFLTAFGSDFAVVADLSPLPAGDPYWKTLNANSPRAVVIKGNSKNHDTDGQNVLYADGHVEFQQTPLCGTMKDNIFTVNAVTTDGNLSLTGESAAGVDPAHAADSVLLNGQ